tara:strand:+ start:42552 stop:44288 length:1737 start_codon:yes stop_codon:yes gene_type:complete
VDSTINILDHNVINQIAAGEVIQRPASVVKELLENSIDALAKNIQINIENSGKTLIQVIDDGKGMNKKDAELSFQKHTTSKIKTTEDIQKISSMGFRGEALASISSIAEVELKTKTEKEEVGTYILIDNSKIKKNQPIGIKKGTSISVKNIFFNIPARKKFLKSDQLEMRKILEVFYQIAISHHNICFKLTHNNSNLYQLPSDNLKQRVIKLFGKKYNEKILPIEENTSIVNIKGFIGNPLDAKKTRGEQFLFVNNRFVKSPYLNHAIKSAMDNLINENKHPSYFIFLNTDPSLIDVNVHPNKTEIKFEDEKSIYQILQSTCKKSIGIYNITPSLDFSIEDSFEVPLHIQKSIPKEPKLSFNKDYNPFNLKKFDSKEDSIKLFKKDERNFVETVLNIDLNYAVCKLINNNSINIFDKKKCIQRIIYEETILKLSNGTQCKQFLIKPICVELNDIDIEVFNDNQKIIESLGYVIEKIEKNNIYISGVPNQIKRIESIQEDIESFIEEFKLGNNNLQEDLIKIIAKKFVKNLTLNNTSFNISETSGLKSIVNKLLNCKNPFIGIDEKPCFINLEPKNIFK